ncbi:hypothetical protein [Sinobaca sp. H24]|uniref:hypothetical protein n=1 Tax=Sinobaca sp. H24 TaxID=2923376 RepID=UPI0020794491|nr:hypothetical protein [Sinobaca sp. H24]
MQRFIERLHNSTRSYTLVDFGILKLCLFSIGLWTGASYEKSLRSKILPVKIIAFSSFVYIIYTTLHNMNKRV